MFRADAQLSRTTAQSAQTIAISATFTAEPVQEALTFWLHELDIDATVSFAPYNQVFQQLLDPTSLLATNQHGLNVILIRLEDWVDTVDRSAAALNSNSLESGHEQLARNVEDLVRAVRAAGERSATPCLICLCPVSEAMKQDERWQGCFEGLESRLTADFMNLPGIDFVSPTELNRLYPVTAYDDPLAKELGHIPYTPLFFTALGTYVARKFYTLQHASHKVIVLDCDQTLWGGVCGEDGAPGVVLDAPRQALQRFMIAQQEAGRLLCLCSKNNEDDVWEVFDRRPDMPLRREHILAWRINWQPKSENLRSLAAELQLGLDSFIFLDDSPMECAEVEAQCPEVLTLQLPAETETIPQFLQHVWAFDRRTVTEEDKQRTTLYRQNLERERFRQTTGGLANFLAGLELEVGIIQVRPEQIERVAQLTQRTNQFNCTTIRRSESEIRQFCQAGGECWTVEVKDRFGAYGLVGVILCQTEADALKVDTFLLSCRTLGRGVEHQMLAKLGAIAQAQNLSWVEVLYRPTAKNQPVRNFLEAVGEPFKQSVGEGVLYQLPGQYAAELTYRPAEIPSWSADQTMTEPDRVVSNRHSAAGLGEAARLSRIATEWYDADLILRATIAHKQRTRPEMALPIIPPRDELERQLTKIWETVLGCQPIGVQDDFFELGGTSLLAVRLFADIDKQFGKKLPLSTLFQAPTVRQLTALLRQTGWTPQWTSLVAMQSKGTKLPLFLVHAGEGHVLFYRDLIRHLGPDQPVYGLQAQGVDGQQPCLDRMEDIAAHYLAEIRTVQPQGPYLLGGRCFGSLVVLEMAQQLRNQGQEVSLLALIDPIVPPRLKSMRYRLRYCMHNLYHPAALLTHILRLSSRWTARKVTKLLAYCFQRVQARYTFALLEPLTRTLVDAAPQRHPGQTALSRARRSYIPQPYPGRITCLVDSERAPLSPYPWPELAAGGVEWLTVPGHQDSMFHEPQVRGLAEKLRGCLETAQATLDPESAVHQDWRRVG